MHRAVSLYIFILICPFFSLQANNAIPVIDSFRLLVDSSGQKIYITYNLFDKECDTVDLTLLVSTDGGESYSSGYTGITGDVGSSVMPGEDKTIVWDYSDDFANITDVNFKVRLIADDKQNFDLSELVSTVSKSKLLEYYGSIIGVRHRTTGYAHLIETKDFIVSFFNDCGLGVEEQDFPYSSYIATNVIGELPGLEDENYVYIIGAHYDTESNTPGADDNGSGVVGTLEAARVLSKYNFEKTIRFIAFDLEEERLYGSSYYVGEIDPDKETIEGYINYEMIGYFSDIPFSQQLPELMETGFPDFYDSVESESFKGNFIGNLSNTASNDIKQKYNEVAALYVPGLRVLSLAVEGVGESFMDIRRSDHASFWDAGYNAIMLTDMANYRNPNYHQPSDIVASLDMDRMTKVVQASIAAIADLAGIMHCDIVTTSAFEIIDSLMIIAANTISEKPLVGRKLYAYPNPMVDFCTVSYTVGSAGKAIINIFDLQGKLRGRLLNIYHQVPGIYEVGLGSTELGLSSGLYFCTYTLDDIFMASTTLAVL